MPVTPSPPLADRSWSYRGPKTLRAGRDSPDPILADAVLDNFSAGSRANLEGALAAGAELVESDVRDFTLVSKTMSELGPEVIVHLAAQGEVRRSIREPALDAETNVVGTVSGLEAGRGAGARRFVLASAGGAIYGEGSDIELPAAQSARLAPLCPQRHEQAAADQYTELYRRMYGLSSVALRLANVYGPRQNPNGEAGVVAIFSEALVNGKRPVIFGDGSQTRDYVFVDDVVEALVAAATGDVKGPVNIATGTETRLLALLERIAATGRMLEPAGEPAACDTEPVFEPRRPGEVAESRSTNREHHESSAEGQRRAWRKACCERSSARPVPSGRPRA